MTLPNVIERFLVNYVWSEKKCREALDSYARKYNLGLAMRVVNKIREIPAHLLEPGWWSTDQLANGRNFLFALKTNCPKYLDDQRYQSISTSFNLAILRSKAPIKKPWK